MATASLNVSWQSDLLLQARRALVDQPPWPSLLSDPHRAIHLAVMIEPYLSLTILGLKTVESRFSTTRRAPWQRVHPQDLLLLKQSSGPISAIAEVGQTWSYEIDHPTTLNTIRTQFQSRLRTQPDFWKSCAPARYATLMQLTRVTPVKPFTCHKRDQRAWVVLQDPAQSVREPTRDC